MSTLFRMLQRTLVEQAQQQSSAPIIEPHCISSEADRHAWADSLLESITDEPQEDQHVPEPQSRVTP